MSNAVDVTAQDFDKEVLQSGIPVLVDFWAEWCGPCKMLSPTVDAIAQDFDGRLKVLKCNIDNEASIAGRYFIQSIPTLILFKDGRAVEQIVGLKSKGDIVSRIQPHLG